MTKRAWWLVALNFLIPGSPQLIAGNRRLGRFGVGMTFLLWALVVVGVVLWFVWRTPILTLATDVHRALARRGRARCVCRASGSSSRSIRCGSRASSAPHHRHDPRSPASPSSRWCSCRARPRTGRTSRSRPAHCSPASSSRGHRPSRSTGATTSCCSAATRAPIGTACVPTVSPWSASMPRPVRPRSSAFPGTWSTCRSQQTRRWPRSTRTGTGEMAARSMSAC